MLPQLFEHQRVAAVGILTDMEQAHCYLLYPSMFGKQISLEHPMFTNALSDTPQLTETFPILNSTPSPIQMAFNDCLMVEKCVLDMHLKRTISCVANLISAASQLPVMESKHGHMMLDFSLDNSMITLLSFRDFEVAQTYDGMDSVCYRVQPYQSDIPSFALKRFYSEDSPTDELNLWKSVYGLTKDQVALLLNEKTNGLLMPWFDQPSEVLQQDPDFVAKVKKLCMEMEEEGKLVGEKWIYGDIRWSNIGCYDVKVEGKEDEYLPVMLDLSSLRWPTKALNFCYIDIDGKSLQVKRLTLVRSWSVGWSHSSPFERVLSDFGIASTLWFMWIKVSQNEFFNSGS